MLRMYDGEYFQRPSPLNNSLSYKVILPHAHTHTHTHTHIHVHTHTLRTRDAVYGSHFARIPGYLPVPSVLPSIPRLITNPHGSLPPSLTRPSGSAF